MQVAATAASFYAAAYQTGDDIVISYRGTDNNPAEMGTGWTTGAGPSRSEVKRAAGFWVQPFHHRPAPLALMPVFLDKMRVRCDKFLGLRKGHVITAPPT